MEDDMPTRICEECTAEVRRAFAFKQMCVKSEATLREYIEIRRSMHRMPITVSTDTDFEYEIKLEKEAALKSLRLLNTSTKNTLQSDNGDEDDHFLDIPDYLNDLTEKLNESDLNFSTKAINISPESAEDMQTKAIDCNQHAEALPNLRPKRSTRRSIAKSTPNITFARSQTTESTKKRRSFACEQCARTFYRNDHLTRHMISHSKANYSCEICNKTFNRKDNLRYVIFSLLCNLFERN